MSDPSEVLFQAAQAALKADAGVIAAFGGASMRIYDVPPQNPPFSVGAPYAIIDTAALPVLAQCFDSVEADLTVNIWSLTDPVGRTQARAIAAAMFAVLTPVDVNGNHVRPTWSLAGFRVVTALPLGVDHLFEAATQAAHSIVRVRYAIDRA